MNKRVSSWDNLKPTALIIWMIRLFRESMAEVSRRIFIYSFAGLKFESYVLDDLEQISVENKLLRQNSAFENKKSTPSKACWWVLGAEHFMRYIGYKMLSLSIFYKKYHSALSAIFSLKIWAQFENVFPVVRGNWIYHSHTNEVLWLFEN